MIIKKIFIDLKNGVSLGEPAEKNKEKKKRKQDFSFENVRIVERSAFDSNFQDC